MSFLKNALKATKNELAGQADAGIIGDTHEFLDTGSYALNALISGSIFGGFPYGRISCLAAAPSACKTMILLSTCREFLIKKPDAMVFYFESEGAISQEQLRKMGVPLDRFIILPVATIEDFRNQAVNILDEYKKTPVDDRPPIFMCLDSLGMLSSRKEVSDIADGKDTRDLSKSVLVKATFRVLTLKAGELKVPMAITVHTYASLGAMYPTQEVAGGQGTIYAASSIVMLSKRKEKEGSDQVGVNIRSKMYKSRLTKENEESFFVVDFVKGLKRYSGLSDLAVEAGIFNKVSTRIELPDGRKMFQSQVDKNPEEHFTKEVLDQIDVYCKKKFCYGSHESVEEVNESEEGETNE